MMLFPWMAFGENSLPAIIDGQLGEDGVLCLGSESSLTATIKNGASPFQGLLFVDVYQTERLFIRYETAVSLDSHETKAFVLQILPQSNQQEYIVQLMAEDQVISALTLPALPVQGEPSVAFDLPLSNASDLVPVENHSTALPMMICLAGYLLLGIAGGYFLLKKWGRRELAWGLIPLLSLLCALSIFLISRGQEYHTPAAVTLCIYDLDSDQINAGAQVSLPGEQEILLSSSGLDISFASTPYSSASWSMEPEIKSTMTARYRQAENQQIILMPDEPWQTKNLRISSLPMEKIALTGMVQPDQAGISGFIKNESDHDFSVCAVFTPLGSMLLPPLKAGEQAEFSMPWAENAYPEKAEYHLGQLTLPACSLTNQQLRYKLSWQLQDKATHEITSLRQLLDPYGSIYSLSNLMQNLLEDYWHISKSPCLFIGLTDTPGRFPLTANKEEITRRGHLAAVISPLDHQAMGADGTLMYLPGTIAPTLASFSDDTLEDTGVIAKNVQLINDPVYVCYSFPEAEETTAEHLLLRDTDSLQLFVSYAVYNFEKMEWTELDSDAALFQRREAQALLQGGKMYLRIQSKMGYYPDGDLQLPDASYLGREE